MHHNNYYDFQFVWWPASCSSVQCMSNRQGPPCISLGEGLSLHLIWCLFWKTKLYITQKYNHTKLTAAYRNLKRPKCLSTFVKDKEVGAPGRTGPQLRLPGHDLTAFDKTGLPAKTKFNSFRVSLLYPPHPPSFSQPTTIGPPEGSLRPGLPHSTILVATEPRKAERLIFKRCTPKLALEF